MHRGRRLQSTGNRQASNAVQPVLGLQLLTPQVVAGHPWLHQRVVGGGGVGNGHGTRVGHHHIASGPRFHRTIVFQPAPHPIQCCRQSPVSYVTESEQSNNSITRLVHSLQRAVNFKMGGNSSKDLRSTGSSLVVASPVNTESQAVGHHQTGRTRSRTYQQQPYSHGRSGTIESHGSNIQPALTRQTQMDGGSGALANNDDIDNINEAHNNFAITSHGPQSSAQHSIPRSLHQLQQSGIPAQGVKVVRLKVAIDKRLTIIDERSPSVLKYKTPHFRALATVEIPPLVAGQRIQVGWIQVCRDMQFVNVYGNEGITSWEFPEIVIDKYRMISDADGKQYPWYGSKTEVQTIEGPTLQPTFVTIHMNDNFFPQVTWYIPHSDYNREPSLEYIYRKQRFYTFLALRDLTNNVYQILKTVGWMMELAIQVDPTSALGERARVLGPVEQERPHVYDDTSGIRLEKYALSPPNANNSQVLVWRPRVGDPKIVVPPVQTTIDVNRYLMATKNQYAKLKQTLQKVKMPS